MAGYSSDEILPALRKSRVIQLNERFFAGHGQKMFRADDGVGGRVGVDVDDFCSPVLQVQGDIIIGWDGAGTSHHDGKVYRLLQKTLKISFLFRVPDIFSVPEH